MAIFRGIGGAGDSTTDATVTAVTEQAVNAATSATQAASSASSAASSASSASTSATNAAASVSTVSDAATAAQTAQTNAETAETNAETAQAAAEAAQTAAETAETNAATSASSAASSAASASGSAVNANTHKLAAQAAQAAAEAAQSQTENIFDQFGDQYLGSKASDPTVDNDGDPLTTGDIYWNSTSNTLRFYSGTAWVAPETIATNAATAAQTAQTAAETAQTAAETAQTDTLALFGSAQDVQDAVNSASASASTATTKASEAASSAATATTASSSAANSALTAANIASTLNANIINDTTPQLGGNLDTNGYKLRAPTNLSIDVNTNNQAGIYGLVLSDADFISLGSDFDLRSRSYGGVVYNQIDSVNDFYINSPNIYIESGSPGGPSNKIAEFKSGAEVALYHTAAKKLETTSTGIGVTGNIDMGTNTITDTKVGQWDTAYGWGNHGTGGYLTGNETITLSGDVSGEGTTSIIVTIADDSHNHVISNIDSLQTTLDSKVPLAGGTMTGFLTLHAAPTNASHAATKEYVDTIASASLHYHDPVRVESPVALTATYNNGTSGVGATLTNAGTQAALVIDGITLLLNDRALIFHQANAFENGVYFVSNVGSGSTNWVLTRSTDTDSYGASDPDALGLGDAFYVLEGDTGAGQLYVMNTEGAITIGTTGITFAEISSAQIYVGGSGIDISGVTISHSDTSSQASVNNSDGTVIQDITLDTFGHVTALGSADLDGRYYTETEVGNFFSGSTAITGYNKTNWDTALTTSTTFGGDVSGTYNAIVVADDSHDHIISNVDGLQSALDAKQAAATALTTSTTFGGDVSGTYNAIVVANDSHTHDTRYYTETEIGSFFGGGTVITGYNKTNWDTAYGWGNHASAGYFTGPNLLPATDNTGAVGSAALTWANGQFTNLTVDSTLTVTSTLNVRAAIDLADGDILRFGTSDDMEIYHTPSVNRIDLTNGDLVIRDDGTSLDPVRFTFGRTSGNFTATGTVAAASLSVLGAYTLPTSDGTTGQVLTTNGAGVVTFQNASGGGGLGEGKALVFANLFG